MMGNRDVTPIIHGVVQSQINKGSFYLLNGENVEDIVSEIYIIIFKKLPNSVGTEQQLIKISADTKDALKDIIRKREASKRSINNNLKSYDELTETDDSLHGSYMPVYDLETNLTTKRSLFTEKRKFKDIIDTEKAPPEVISKKDLLQYVFKNVFLSAKYNSNCVLVSDGDSFVIYSKIGALAKDLNRRDGEFKNFSLNSEDKLSDYIGMISGVNRDLKFYLRGD